MEAKLYNQSGDEVGTLEVDEYIFGIEPNVPVMHQASVMQKANARSGTHNTKGRGEVSGSTRKLYRQKGTGRARQGSARAPHRKHGGVAHGPHPRSYAQKMNRKMRRLAVRSALSAKFAADQIRFVEGLALEVPRTKEMASILAKLNLGGMKTLIAISATDHVIKRSASNLEGVKTLQADYLNVIDLLTYDYLVLPREALDTVVRILGQAGQEQQLGESAE